MRSGRDPTRGGGLHSKECHYVPLTAVRLTRPAATGAKGALRETWFWWLGGRPLPPLAEVARLYPRCFSIEHVPFRYARSLVDGTACAHAGADGTLDDRRWPFSLTLCRSSIPKTREPVSSHAGSIERLLAPSVATCLQVWRHRVYL